MLSTRHPKVYSKTEKLCLSINIVVFPLDVTTPRGAYATNFGELATLPILSESYARY